MHVHARPPRLFAWLFAAAGLLAPCGVRGRAATPAAARPNIIFILADDLGYGDLGCYGQKKIKTPRLDRMAAEGVRFTQFYAGATVCAPSRCTLMTGLHNGHARVRGNADVPLAPGDVTVAELLHGAGYRTALVGKWGLGEAGTTGVPTKQGFDSFYGYLNQVHAHNYYPTFLWRNEEKVPLKNEVNPAANPAAAKEGAGIATRRVEYTPDLFAAEALSFVEKNKTGPFFLYLALTVPHANGEASPHGMEVPDQGEYAKEHWPEEEKNKAAMITRMDADVGRLLDLLATLSIDDNTVVFFASDNGPHREGGVDPAFFNSSGPLRGIKRDLYEGGVRVPMIVRWPGHAKAGSASDHVGSFQDFLATAADLAVAPAPRTDGLSFLPSVLGQPGEQRRHDYLYWEFYEGKGSCAVRFGDWKAVHKPLACGKTELYDLKADLGERHDLAAEHPDLVEKAEALMKEGTCRRRSRSGDCPPTDRRRGPRGGRHGRRQGRRGSRNAGQNGPPAGHAACGSRAPNAPQRPPSPLRPPRRDLNGVTRRSHTLRENAVRRLRVPLSPEVTTPAGPSSADHFPGAYQTPPNRPAALPHPPSACLRRHSLFRISDVTVRRGAGPRAAPSRVRASPHGRENLP